MSALEYCSFSLHIVTVMIVVASGDYIKMSFEYSYMEIDAGDKRYTEEARLAHGTEKRLCRFVIVFQVRGHQVLD